MERTKKSLQHLILHTLLGRVDDASCNADRKKYIIRDENYISPVRLPSTIQQKQKKNSYIKIVVEKRPSHNVFMMDMHRVERLTILISGDWLRFSPTLAPLLMNHIEGERTFMFNLIFLCQSLRFLLA